MYKSFVFIILSGLLLFISWEYAEAENSLDNLLAESGFENGWIRDSKPRHYNPENLYEYINGEAELYHSYGFRELSTLTYLWRSEEDTFFVVNIYDMSTELNAFGVYSSYRYPGYQFEHIGVEAMVSDYELKFYHGQYFVDISAGDDSEKIKSIIRIIAQIISSKIEEPIEPPEELKFLSKEDQVDKTLKYVSKEMLSQAFLPEGLEARYHSGDEEITGFIVIFDSTDKANKGLEELKKFYKETDYEFVVSELPEQVKFGVKTTYSGYFLISSVDRFLIGVKDFSVLDNGIELLGDIRKHLVEYVGVNK